MVLSVFKELRTSVLLLGCTVNPDDYMPTRRNQRIFRKGEMLRLIRGVLKDADRPMTSREICLAILPPDFDLSDKRRVNQVTSRVYKTLCRESASNRVDSYGKRPMMFRFCSFDSTLKNICGTLKESGRRSDTGQERSSKNAPNLFHTRC